MVKFTKKMTGAKAHLFAKVCEQYMEAIEQPYLYEGLGQPAETPLFSWLSPYQRVQLVRQVMVGLLCPDEPLPPGTVQHLAAYYAMAEFLKTQVEMEIDYPWGHDIPDDLRLDDEDSGRRRRTDDEQAEFERNQELIRDRAERNKKKLDKQEATDFHLEGRTFNLEEKLSDLQGIHNTIFSNPLLKEQREKVRKPATSDEKFAFRWRLLCDEAFQENTEISLFPPLAQVCFDFRSISQGKWHTAIDILFVTNSGAKTENKEDPLVRGAINNRSYADMSQHARIQTIKKHVFVLRKMYERTWDSNLLAQDQRCIYALCSNVLHAGYGHVQFVANFVKKLTQRHNIDFAEPGNYQERYNVYKEINEAYHEGLKYRLHAHSEQHTVFRGCKTPANYTCDGENIHASCAKCWSFVEEDLKSCSKCKVICYCSRECQVADWPNHRKQCKEMAKLRKDKAAISELAKKM